MNGIENSIRYFAKSAPFRKGKASALAVAKMVHRISSSGTDYAEWPPIVVNSLPKSGTHLLLQVILGLPRYSTYDDFIATTPSLTMHRRSDAVLARKIARLAPGEVCGAHLDYSERIAEALQQRWAVSLFIYRDPRDVFWSEMQYLLSMNRWHRSGRQARRFLDFDPSSFAARYLIGRAALGAGKYDDAIASFQDVLRKKSDHCRAMTNMGTAFSAKSDWANALTALENATRCDPKLNLAWQTKGFVLQKTASATSDPTKKQQAYQDAIDAYRKALEIKPSSSITAKIEACEQNIRVSRQNQGMASEEAANLAAIEEEKRRVAEEERKRLEWKKTQEEDD